jgi:hypothetical protein
MDLPPNFEYFEKGNGSVFERLIKEQGSEVCQNMLHENYISAQSKKYSFGFVHTMPVAQIGQKTRSKTANRRGPFEGGSNATALGREDVGGSNATTRIVSSFILCNLFPEFEQVEISLVCSRENAKHGKILMDLVYEKAKELKYKYLFLLSLSEEKIINWYKRQGFKILSEKFHENGEIKAYAMMKHV